MRTNPSDTLYIAGPRLNQLNILKEVAGDPNLTQAELARRCGLSVSMINNYMKEMCSLHWLEYHRRSIKDVSYHLTPAGHDQLQCAQYDLIRELVALFAETKTRILDFVRAEAGVKPCRAVLYGSGHLAEVTFHALSSTEIKIIAVCDDGTGSPRRTCCGLEILDALQMAHMDADTVVVATDSSELAPEIETLLDNLHERGTCVVRLNADSRPSLGVLESLSLGV